MTRSQSPLSILLACAVVGFLFTLAIHALRGGYPPARMAYAIFVTGVPVIVAWPIAAWLKLSRKWIVVVYVGVFVVIVLVQAGVR